jgi:hypothetical protein
VNSQYDNDLLAVYQTNPESEQPQQPAYLRDRIAARMTPLEDRLRQKLTQFPAELAEQGLRMSQLWPLCSGVQRSKPRAFEVADALRALGWKRVRVYSDKTNPSSTLWLPPTSDLAEARQAFRRRKS